MRVFASLALSLSLVLSFISPSLGHAHQGRRHHNVHRSDDLARRDPGELTLHKRDDRFTYFAVGLGACGVVNVPSDFIVALAASQFTQSDCFQMITITVGEKSTQAQIMDSCPGCPPNGLDFSQGLFEFFADISVGVLSGSWSYGSGGSSPAPSPTPSPSPSPSPPPTTSDTPTSTWSPTPTTTSQALSTTTTSASTTTSPSSSGFSSGTGSSSAPSGTPANVGSQPSGVAVANASVLLDLNSYSLYIGIFLAGCGSS